MEAEGSTGGHSRCFGRGAAIFIVRIVALVRIVGLPESLDVVVVVRLLVILVRAAVAIDSTEAIRQIVGVLARIGWHIFRPLVVGPTVRRLVRIAAASPSSVVVAAELLVTLPSEAVTRVLWWHHRIIVHRHHRRIHRVARVVAVRHHRVIVHRHSRMIVHRHHFVRTLAGAYDDQIRFRCLRERWRLIELGWRMVEWRWPAERRLMMARMMVISVR